MVSGLFSDPNYVGVKKMLDATVMRHEAIASNLANMETPNYKRIDVDPSFSHALQKAMATGKPNQIQSVRPRLMVDQKALSPNRDGNTVQLDNELMNLQQNGLNHQLETQLVSSRLTKLRLAIKGRN